MSPLCLGPTLLRPEEETVAAIMDIKFANVVVELLIQNWEPLLRTKPDTNPPPKPTKSSVSAVTSPVSSSRPAKASPGPVPSTLVQTVIFDSSKM